MLVETEWNKACERGASDPFCPGQGLNGAKSGPCSLDLHEAGSPHLEATERNIRLENQTSTTAYLFVHAASLSA